VHGLKEDEFFDLENFSSRGDLLARVHTYQLYFNLVHPNSHKDAAILVEGGRCSRSLSLLAKKFRRGIPASLLGYLGTNDCSEGAPTGDSMWVNPFGLSQSFQCFYFISVCRLSEIQD